MSAFRLPPSTVARLQQPAVAGERHHQMLGTVLPLFASGLNRQAVFAQYRGMFAEDVTDAEIWGIVNWGESKQPARAQARPERLALPQPPKPRTVTPEAAAANAERFLQQRRIDEADLWHESKIYPGADWTRDAALLFAHLYAPDEFVCVNTDHHLEPKKDGTEKAVIDGPGVTLTAREWAESIGAKGPPQSAAGAWVRLNPVASVKGSGKSGAHTDPDVSRHAYLLVESDTLPLDLQLSLYAYIRLPVCAVILSGGNSAHAWIRLDAPDAFAYRNAAAAVMGTLRAFGFDRSNVNPSRYGRLPGAHRTVGASGDGQQKLLFLNPNPTGGIFP